jgi:hypothetical protein
MINRMKERGIILHVGLHLDDIVAGMNWSWLESIYCYSIMSSGAPLFVNFLLFNLSLMVTYNLLCRI